MRASMNVLIPVALLACAGLAALPSAGGIAAGGRIAFALTLQADEVYGLAPGATIPRRLTSTIWASTQPAESPDGRKVLFAANPGGKYDVYAMNLDGSGLVDLTAGSSGNDEEPAWSPDGRRVAFISDRLDQNDEIYVMNADGKGVTRVATDPFDAEFPSWSPDGTRLAFDTGARSSGDVYTIGVDGTGMSQVTSGAANEWGPKWSPDGSLIAYTVDLPVPGSPRASYGDISVIRPDGTGARRLTTTSRDDEEYAAWSPDGSKVAYSTVVSPAGNCGIDVVNRDGSGRHSIAPFCKRDLLYDAHYLDWARDGTLHFASQSLNSEIATIGVDGTGESVLTKTDDSSESGPAWSPDGRTIAFASDRSGNEDIWLMTAEGRRLRDLTRSSHVDDVEPAWSHDGRRIAFATARGRELFDHTGSPYRLDEVYVMGASGLSPHRVIASAGSDEEPAWSPNGAQLAFTRFVSNAHGTFDGSIRLARSDGALVHALPGGRIGDGDPSWAPHGGRVAFVSGRAGRRQIFVAASDRPRVRQLTFGSAPSAEPSWSPRGSKIVFDRWVAKRLEIWVMNADGSGRQRVAVACDDRYSTDPLGLCAFATAHPVWQPGT